MSEVEPTEPEKSDEGNAETLVAQPKKQPNQCIHWHFRLSNYKNRDIESILFLFSSIATRYAFQEEIGEKGTPHLQGTVSLKQKARYTEFSPNKSIHWETVKDLGGSLEYCCKEDTRKPGTTPYLFNFTPPRSLDVYEGPWSPWQTDVFEYIRYPANIRDIKWIWSAGGKKGKSSTFRYMCIRLNCIPLTYGKESDIINILWNEADINSHPALLIDMPRCKGNNLPWSTIEKIKSGIIVNTKFKTGYKYFNNINIVVFANMPPPDAEEELMSTDRFLTTCID